MSQLITIITSTDPEVRDRSLDAFCRSAPLPGLLAECRDLDAFRRRSDNLYEHVRALFFLYAIHRFHIPLKEGVASRGLVPFSGYTHLLQRRFEEAIESFLEVQEAQGPSDAISSALAAAYHGLGFQTLADQVRRSVRSVRGNQWMFRMGHPADQPLRIRRELLESAPGEATPQGNGAPFPILREQTPVRMDLSHSGWSDIFFLGMDFPEGARVLNVSIDLAVRGRDKAPRPPVEAYLRVIDEPKLRLSSVDLGATADITELSEVFDYARDYLGLLKAAVVAAGIVPPGIEGSGQSLAELLARIVGPGRGIELVSNVNNIPKGSRLAVSTNLLACLISVCMRATGQAKSLTGALDEEERRLVAARAILGEWLAGSGGGWQDSGGLWPGIKLIRGELAREGDPEYGISRGRLLPVHRIFGHQDASSEVRQKLQESLVLVHGGMAQNVGPILEMVTEKYLLRAEAEWEARKEAIGILDEIAIAMHEEDVRRIGAATTRNFTRPIQTIIPWASNCYTETLIGRVRAEFGEDFWGFWMLGGMSGGGMGFIFAPEQKARAQERLLEMMLATKREMQNALPFAMDPVVYDFAINQRGTYAHLLQGEDALLPPGYYAITVPQLLRGDPHTLSPARRTDLDRFGDACRSRAEMEGMVRTLFDRLLPKAKAEEAGSQPLDVLLRENGFDRAQHEQIRADLRGGRIGLAQNRLPADIRIEDVRDGDVVDAAREATRELRQAGMDALASGTVAVVSLAGGVGSRWTQGAGVVKALHPFCKLGGRHRTFIEVHLAKSRRISRACGVPVPHVFTTSYHTNGPIQAYLATQGGYGSMQTADYRPQTTDHRPQTTDPFAPSPRHPVTPSPPHPFTPSPLHPFTPSPDGECPLPLLLSPGRAIGLRLIPMERDLRFAWEETAQQVLDEQKQKVRESLHQALIGWARQAGEGSDYTDNMAMQCVHPVGHWFEVPNMLRNGVLARLLDERPSLQTLMLHNIDTLGADLDPAMLGLHRKLGSCLTFEMITRRIDDRGGGLARVNGRVRLVEGLAMPHEEDEFALSYYNSNTVWIDIDRLLGVFGLTRGDLGDAAKVAAAIRRVAARMPTYITLKEVKKRWGHGQEDIFPVSQFEKLWGDMTALPEVECRFAVVPRARGQQLKDQAQLDGWLRDGSAAYVESLCDFTDQGAL